MNIQSPTAMILVALHGYGEWPDSSFASFSSERTITC